MPAFVLSVLGDDRPGLVEKISAVVTEHGGNWDRSHVTRLAGKFAGVVLVTTPSDQVDGFLTDLRALDQEGLVHVSVDRADHTADHAAALTGSSLVEIGLVGGDHPGIVHELAQLLAERSISIDDLQTWTSRAPLSGDALFHARAYVRLPGSMESDELRDELEALASDLMVDVDFIPDLDQNEIPGL